MFHSGTILVFSLNISVIEIVMMIQHTKKNLSALFLDGDHQVERIMWENYVHVSWVEPWNGPNVITDNANWSIIKIKKICHQVILNSAPMKIKSQTLGSILAGKVKKVGGLNKALRFKSNMVMTIPGTLLPSWSGKHFLDTNNWTFSCSNSFFIQYKYYSTQDTYLKVIVLTPGNTTIYYIGFNINSPTGKKGTFEW